MLLVELRRRHLLVNPRHARLQLPGLVRHRRRRLDDWCTPILGIDLAVQRWRPRIAKMKGSPPPPAEPSWRRAPLASPCAAPARHRHSRRRAAPAAPHRRRARPTARPRTRSCTGSETVNFSESQSIVADRHLRGLKRKPVKSVVLVVKVEVGQVRVLDVPRTVVLQALGQARLFVRVQRPWCAGRESIALRCRPFRAQEQHQSQGRAKPTDGRRMQLVVRQVEKHLSRIDRCGGTQMSLALMFASGGQSLLSYPHTDPTSHLAGAARWRRTPPGCRPAPGPTCRRAAPR